MYKLRLYGGTILSHTIREGIFLMILCFSMMFYYGNITLKDIKLFIFLGIFSFLMSFVDACFRYLALKLILKIRNNRGKNNDNENNGE